MGDGSCAAACPEVAIQLGRTPFIDRDRCTTCFDCVDGCPSGALSRVGEAMSLDALVGRLLRDKLAPSEVARCTTRFERRGLEVVA